MKKLSVGIDSTLGNYRKLCVTFFGEESPATKFIDSKIATDGENEEVIADESQMIYLLGNMHIGQ